MTDKKFEEESDPKQKIEILKLICSKLLDKPPLLEMDEEETQMLAVEEQYAAHEAKRIKK